MSREYNISWNKAQRAKLNSAARKYNNAIRRAKRTNPESAEFLPDEVSYRELKESITTRRALQNKVNSLNRATKPNALGLHRQNDGSIVTNYERGEYNILKSVRERRKSMAAKNLDKAKSGIGSMQAAKNAPDGRKAGELSSGALRRFIETQERIMNTSSREAMNRYADNYMDAMESVFGGYSQYDTLLGELRAILETLRDSPVRLEDAISTAPGIAFIYDPLERDEKIKRIMEYWKEVSGDVQ